jgi:translin
VYQPSGTDVNSRAVCLQDGQQKGLPNVDDSATKAQLERLTQAIIQRFEARSTLRDGALAESRQIVRRSANAVRALHRGDLPAAHALLDDARIGLQRLLDQLAGEPELLYAGYVQDAMREYAEGCIAAAIVGETEVPRPEELGISDQAFLNALAEAASELRRQVLDLLRAGDTERAEVLLGTMDDIYAALLLVDFPDAMTGGLRRSVDSLRAVLERSRGDVTAAVGQARVSRELLMTRQLLQSSDTDQGG